MVIPQSPKTSLTWCCHVRAVMYASTRRLPPRLPTAFLIPFYTLLFSWLDCRLSVLEEGSMTDSRRGVYDVTK